ncbi:MAG: glycine cleavage T C-terminal barrel domain-containing protein, partial [Rhodobacterales bacterium]
NTTFWPVTIDGRPIGKVTSAVYSPRLRQNIALAMVAVDRASLGTQVEVSTPTNELHANIVEKPFFDPKKQIARH